jgi:hypothetical protein
MANMYSGTIGQNRDGRHYTGQWHSDGRNLTVQMGIIQKTVPDGASAETPEGLARLTLAQMIDEHVNAQPPRQTTF